jgi:Tfp pilus assembly protein PilN
MLPLNHDLLSLEGLRKAYKQAVLNKNELNNIGAPNLLAQFKNRCENMGYPTELPAAEYDALYQAMDIIRGSEDKNDIATRLDELTETESDSFRTKVNNEWMRLNNELGYFPNETTPPTSYIQLAKQCRAMVVLIEKNNTPDDTLAYTYAYKLMVLCGTESDLKQIAQRATQLITNAGYAKSQTAYHDVLLNQLSFPKAQDITDLNGWRALFDNEKSNTSAALRLLANASAIEAKIAETAEDKMRRAPKTLSEGLKAETLCVYARAQENPVLAALCKQYNIPEDGPECCFNKCLNYLNTVTWPIKTTDSLPQVQISVESGEDTYVWTRLPTNDYRALFLGVITGCCQSIGGHSQQCVKDAVSLADNGIYVLLKGKRGKEVSWDGAINYKDFKIVGQAYGWLSKTGNLTLDSFEGSKINGVSIAPLAVAQNVLTQFGQTILQDHSEIKYVTLGTGGGTPKNLGFAITSIPETMRSGHFYGDAGTQVVIASSPKLINDATNERWAAVLKNKSETFRQCMEYLNAYLPQDSLLNALEQDPTFETALTPTSMQRIVQLNISPNSDDLSPINRSDLSENSLARLAWRDCAIDELLTYLLHIPEQQRLMVFKLHASNLSFPDKENVLSIISIISSIPASDRLAAIKEPDKNLYSVLHYAVSRRDNSFNTILALLPEKERLAAVKENDKDGSPLLHGAASYPDRLNAILALYPENERLAAVKENDGYGNAVLRYAASYPHSLNAILTLLPENDRLAAIKGKDADGKSVLHYAASDPDRLKAILALLPENDRLAAVKEKDGYGRSVLHDAANYPDRLKAILALLPENDRLAAVKEKNRYGKSVLHYAANYPDSLKAILTFIPKNERLDAVKGKDSIDHKSVLHYAYNNPDSLNTILAIYPENERLDAVKEQDGRGKSVLHYAASHPDSLKTILALYPENERLDAVKEKNRYGESVLSDAASKPDDSLNTILALLPEKERLDVIKVKDRGGKSVLHYAASKPDRLKAILALLPENDRLAAVKEKDGDGLSLLHYTACDPDSLKAILSLYPENERLAAVKEKDRDGDSVLHYTASTPNLLAVILNSIPRWDLPNLPKEFLEKPQVQEFFLKNQIPIIFQTLKNSLMKISYPNKTDNQNSNKP